MKLEPKAKRRLTTLIKFMRSLPASANKHFKMDSWAAGIYDKSGPLTAETLKECGTSACAAGWAATIPSFRRAGYSLNASTGRFSKSPSEFFDVRGTLFEELFLMNDAKTPKQWARYAERAIKQHEAQQ